MRVIGPVRATPDEPALRSRNEEKTLNQFRSAYFSVMNFN